MTFVQSRLGSTRLPRKALADLDGRCLIEVVMAQAEKIGYPVVLLIPVVDKELAALALAHDWIYHEGDEEDVLGRFAAAARSFNPDHIIRVCGDSPFIDPVWARRTVAEHLRGDWDFTSDHENEGRGIQVFRTAALLKADELAYPPERHSPDLLFTGSGSLQIWKTQTIRTSVDNADDLERAWRWLKED